MLILSNVFSVGNGQSMGKFTEKRGCFLVECGLALTNRRHK